MPDIRRRIVLAANSAWHVANFRPQLIRALTSRGYQVIVAAPADGDGRLAALGVRQVEIDLSRSGLNPIADLRLLAAYGRTQWSGLDVTGDIALLESWSAAMNF